MIWRHPFLLPGCVGQRIVVERLDDDHFMIGFSNGRVSIVSETEMKQGTHHENHLQSKQKSSRSPDSH